MKKIHDYYTQEELIQLTQSLIKIPSHKDVPTREKEVAEFIFEFCQQQGLEVKLEPVDKERSNVLAFLRGDGTGKTLMLNGHTDTVPPYNMTIEPFGAEIKDGAIWGRGAVDMKGPIASMLITMLALKRAGVKLKGDVIFTGVIGEEERSEGTEHLVKSGLKADGAVVGEPSHYEYAIGHRGLEWLEIRIKGKAAHGGVPHLGVNAIEKAAALIERIKKELYPKLRERHNEYMGPSVMNFGVIQGGSQPSTVADACSIRIDRRYIPGETVASVLKEYQDIIDAIKAEDPEFDAEIIRMPNNMLTLDHLYLMTSPDAPIVLAVKDAIQEVIEKEPEITRKRGWTDAALLSNYGKIPTVVFGPGRISFSHTKDERVEISELIDAVEIYAKIIEKFCGIEK
ncbi:M20 family metallopeptidase [Clostridiaceae bacterium 35-E11]